MTSLTLVRRIKARPSIVFDALTTPEGIACWWGPDGGPVLVAETDPQVGGRFRVRFRMLDGSGRPNVTSVVTAAGVEPSTDLRFYAAKNCKGGYRMITISAFKWVPEFAQGQVRDLRARWALEEAGLPYKTRLLELGDQDEP